MTAHFHWLGLKVWRTLRRNLLKSLLAWSQLLAVLEEVLRILTLQGSAVGSNSRANFSSQGFLLIKGSQQGSF